MKTFLLALILSVGFTANATYLPLSETITIGGRVINPNKAGFKILYTVFGQTTNESSAREPGAAVGYVVPATKTFKIVAAEVLTMGVAGPVYLGYNDVDAGFASGGGTFVNFVGVGGATFTQLEMARSTTVGEKIDVSLDFVIPAGKYTAVLGPGGAGGTAATVKLYGYEE